MPLRNKLQKLQNRAARVLTYSNFGVDASYLFNSGGKIKHTSSKLKELRATTSPCTGQLQNISVLNSRGEAPHMKNKDSEKKLTVPLRAQLITKIASAIYCCAIL